MDENRNFYVKKIYHTSFNFHPNCFSRGGDNDLHTNVQTVALTTLL